jgi:hypothetical protein
MARLFLFVMARSKATKQFRLRHSGAMQKHRTRNLEIPRCAIAHLRSGANAPSRNDSFPDCFGSLSSAAHSRDPLAHPGCYPVRGPSRIIRFLKFRNFACQRTQISSLIRAVLPHRGACARHERGAGCGGRGSARDERGLFAYGEVVSFWRPNAGVKSAIRSAGDGVKQAWSPGRARSKP